jgi:hypothetical protein
MVNSRADGGTRLTGAIVANTADTVPCLIPDSSGLARVPYDRAL